MAINQAYTQLVSNYIKVHEFDFFFYYLQNACTAENTDKIKILKKLSL